MKESEIEIEQILENIAEAVAASKTAPPTIEDDPFDFYVKRVQFSAFSREDLFKKRFIKGYHVLMNALDPKNN
ncbi:MAG TPA: hypothetical protein PLC42_03155 [Parachlamydiaceae bacterium]|nr:hypothetical protein [Parachlamydiaceae bacterium]